MTTATTGTTGTNGTTNGTMIVEGKQGGEPVRITDVTVAATATPERALAYDNINSGAITISVFLGAITFITTSLTGVKLDGCQICDCKDIPSLSFATVVVFIIAIIAMVSKWVILGQGGKLDKLACYNSTAGALTTTIMACAVCLAGIIVFLFTLTTVYHCTIQDQQAQNATIIG